MGQEISQETLVLFLTYFDYVCVGFLAFEVMIGIIARGFVQSEGALPTPFPLTTSFPFRLKFFLWLLAFPSTPMVPFHIAPRLR